MSRVRRRLPSSLLLSLALCLALARPARAQGPELEGPLPGPLPLFPPTNWWNLDISQAPVDGGSSSFVNFIQANGRRQLHPDMGGDPYGMPYAVVPGTQPLVPVTFYYASESDPGAPGRPVGYPIPEQAKTQPRWIEGGVPGGGSSGDRHMLLVDRDNRLLYELYALQWNTAAGRWDAGSGAVFPLDTNRRRPDGWTSADAAGLAILPGLIRYDEVFGPDPIRHAFRFTVRSTNGYVYPASHRAGSTAGALPMGARLRLKASKDLSAYPAHIRKIFQAMKTYGLIVADNGSDMYITGTNDNRWNMDEMLPAFRSLYADDFEVVQLGWNPQGQDNDADGLPDGWETQFGLSPASAAGADGAAGDPDGDGVSNLDEFRNGTHPRGTFRRYFAEGVTSTFFSTRFAFANPGTQAVKVLCRFQSNGGTTRTAFVEVPPRARRTIDANSVPGLAAAEFSTIVEADGFVAADRAVWWDGRGYGSHGETGIAAPATTWYLAEGATHSGFELFYLLQNPGSSGAAVRITYLRPSPQSPIQRTYTVPAASRFTVWVDREDPGLAATDVSAVVQSTNGVPIIVERSMYLDAGGLTFGAGHESAAVPAPSTQWFLAEGATGSYFDLFILIANPQTTAARVNVRYLLPDGRALLRTYTVSAQSRFNIWVDNEDPLLANTAVSTVLTSTNGVPIIVERSMWWPGPSPAGWREAHNSAGATLSGVRWVVADGEVGGGRNADTYLLIANVSAGAAIARVTLFFEDGTAEASRDFAVGANARYNVDVRNAFPIAVGRRFGALIASTGTSPPQLVVERATYWDANGEHWAAGMNALAALW